MTVDRSPHLAELDRLQDRVSQLARDKASLQLAVNLIQRLSGAVGLENVLEQALEVLIEGIGGTNQTIFYLAGNVWHSVDVHGVRRTIDPLDDPVVAQVAATRSFVQVPGPEPGPGAAEENGPVETWGFPLLVGGDLLGAIRLDGMMVDRRHYRENVEPFITYMGVALFHYLSSARRLHSAVSAAEQTRQALHESNQLLTSMFESSPLAIVAVDLEGVVTRWSPAAERIFGWREAEVVGRFLPFIPADRRSEFRSTKARALREHGLAELEVLRVDKAGRSMCVSLSVAPLKDCRGTVTGLVGVLGDISERKRSEQALAWELSLSKTLADLSHTLISVEYDESAVSGLVLASAHSITRSSGGWAGEVEAGSGRVIAHAVINPDVIQPYVSVAPDGRQVLTRGPDGRYPGPFGACLSAHAPVVANDADETHAQGDGPLEATVPLSRLLAVPVTFRGRLLGQIAVFNKAEPYGPRDQLALERLAELYAMGLHRCRVDREHSQLQEQLRHAQKMEALGTLAGGVAHDFNNILTPIMAHTDLLLHSLPATSELREDVQQVALATNRATALVNQILAFSRRKPERRTVVDVGQIVEEALKLLRASIPSSITIEPLLQSDAGSVLADPSHIHQILMNLCTNSQHAMREAGGLLQVLVKPADLRPKAAGMPTGLEPGAHVRLAVRDTGHGMDPETVARIFDPYFTTKEIGEGSGLGLAVVHGIVASYGGGITVDSAVGKGTTISVYLPRTATASQRAELPAAAEEKIGHEEHILFVDDEPMIAAMGQRMLTNMGFRVTSFCSSNSALASFLENPRQFDLVITDQTLPELSGADLARRILASRPELPIIICTGYSHSIDEKRALALGAKAFVMKPYSRDQLGHLIQKVLRG